MSQIHADAEATTSKAFESAGNLKVSGMKRFLGDTPKITLQSVPFHLYLRTSADFVLGLTVGRRKGEKHREQTSVVCLRHQREQAICVLVSPGKLSPVLRAAGTRFAFALRM